MSDGPPPDLVPPPLPASPVSYASPGDFEHLRWTNARVVPAVTWAVTMIVVAHLALGIVTPRMEGILADFKMELPAITKGLIGASRAYRDWYLWVVTTPVFIAIPMLWLTLATPRRRERLPRLAGTFVSALLIVWVLLGLLLPLLALYQGIGASNGKK